MSDHADANLVIAALRPEDALHERAVRHLEARALTVTFAVAVEVLLLVRRFGWTHREFLVAVEEHFTLEQRETLYAAAHALDKGVVRTVFDAVHLAEALHRGRRLHTADAALLATRFPTTPF